MEKVIKHTEDGDKGMFFYEGENGIISEINYTLRDNGILVIDHTESEPEGEGKGLASKLVEKVVEYARENDYMVDPVCSFAAAQFKRHDEYSDVLAEGME